MAITEKNNAKLIPLGVLYLAFALIMASFLYPPFGYAEENATSKIMALVGVKISPAIPFKKQGEIPGWNSLGSFFVGSDTVKVYGENGYIGNEGGFILINLDSDMTRTVIDARALPMEFLRFDLNDGKLEWRQNANKKFSVESCNKAGANDPIIGLMRPELGKEGCLHYSRNVKMAWRLNGTTGKMEEISPDGVSCFFPNGEDECY